MTLKKQMITAKDGKRYVLEALKNAKQFLKDAEVLIDNGSYAHGAALAVLAIEEGAKAKMAPRYITWNGKLEVDAKTYQKEIKNHLTKLSLAAKNHWIDAFISRLKSPGSCSLHELSERLKQVKKENEFLKNLEIESALYACLTILKEKWLYVDIEEGEVRSPCTWSKNDSKKVLQMAKERLRKYEARLAEELK